MEQDIYIDEVDTAGDAILSKHQAAVLPIWIMTLFEYNIPIYVNVGWFRRLIWKLCGAKFERVKR